MVSAANPAEGIVGPNRAPPDEEVKRFSQSFYRGEQMGLNPYRGDIDKPFYLERFLLRGWMPASPPIGRETKITAFGSCFAQNISRHLSAIGYDLAQDRNPDVHVSKMGEGLVNVYALLGQFEWALENIAPPGDLWHGYKAEAMGYSEEMRLATRDIFLATDFFIITLGLSEVWYDAVTGGVFWRAVPERVFDPSRHRFRVCSMAETKAALQRMLDIIARHVPRAKVLFTLSPIPLAATFRPVGCVTANAASKAILRASVDEFMRDNQERVNESLFYFPSYEIASELFFERYQRDNRHPPPYVIEVIMKTFEAVYCQSGLTLEEVHALLLDARRRNAARIVV